jgi:acetyl esterase/lipase
MQTLKLLTIGLGLLGSTAAALAQTEVNLYTGTPPGNLSTINREERVMTDVGRPALRKVTVPSVTYFKPAGSNPSRTAVLICPGGGYHRLSIFDGGYDVAQEFAKAGVHAFVLKYRTYTDSAYTNFETLPFRDMQQAYQLIRQQANQYNIDTTRIGILGFSAGGHLAAMASTPTYRLRLAFNILVYPVISFADSLVAKRLQSRRMLFGKTITEAQKRAYSPEQFIAPNHPPSYLIHAMDDSTSLVNNSVVYYQALIARRIPAQLHIYQKGGHGFALYNKEENDYWLPSVLKWLRLNRFIP